MQIVELSPHVAVSAQITPGDVAAIAAAGYRVLVNNRPDGEEANQPTSAAIAAAAAEHGLEYHYLPVTGLDFPGPGFDRMSGLLADESRPVLAFCRSGTRCANLWVASSAADARPAAMARAGSLGFDLAMVARLG